MIILVITDKATSEDFYIGEEECRITVSSTLRHFKPYLKKFTASQKRIDKVYGGMVKLSGTGSIQVSPYCLKWPPPLKIDVEVKDVDKHGRVVNFFESTAYIDEINEEFTSYTLYSKEYEVNLLDSAPDWPDYGTGAGTPTETDRVYPLAIGTVKCVLPLRIGNDTTEAYYHKAGITGINPNRTTGDYDVFDTGFQRQVYGTGLGTIIDSGTYFKSVLASDGTTLNPPLSEFRLTGTNTDINTLVKLFEWATTRINTELGTYYTLNTTYARSPSPNVSYFVESQVNIFDFLSEISAWHTHLFYVNEVNLEIVLVDMFANNGTLALSDTEGNFLQVTKKEYKYPSPIKSINTAWKEVDAGFDASDYPLFTETEKSFKLETDNINGSKESVTPFNYLIGQVSDAVTEIGKIVQYPRFQVDVLMSQGEIYPGTQITFRDKRFKNTVDITGRISTIQYKPTKPDYTMTLEGYIYT